MSAFFVSVNDTLFIRFPTDYLAETVVDVVNTAVGNKPTTRDSTDPHPGSEWVLKFKRFAQNFIRNASVGMPAFLVALVYIAESRPRISAEEWGHKGVFLGALIVASKVRSLPISENCQYPDHVLRSTPPIIVSGLITGFALQFSPASKH